MAGDWIKWTKGLTRKREVIDMAARLSLSPQHIAAVCMEFWEWLDDNVGDSQIDENGNASVTLGSLQPAFLDALVMTPGFAAAMSAVGWITPRNGSLVVPKYGRHNGQTAKDRALTKNRVAKARSRTKGEEPEVDDVTAQPLPEKRRGEGNAESPSQREGARKPPELAVVLAAAGNLGVSKEVAEIFFHDCEKRPLSPRGMWTDRDGREIAKWQSAMKAYAGKWQANGNERASTQSKNHATNRNPQNHRTSAANASNANAAAASEY